MWEWRRGLGGGVRGVCVDECVDVGEGGGGAPPGDGDEMAMMAALTRPTAARPLREEGRCGWRE